MATIASTPFGCLTGSLSPRRRPGPEPKYGAIAQVVEQIWTAGEQPCGKRLAQTLPLWLPYYQRCYGRVLPSQQRLAKTLDRLLASLRARLSLKRLSGTKPGSLLRQQTPIQGEVWDEQRRPGFWRQTAWPIAGQAWPAASCGP